MDRLELTVNQVMFSMTSGYGTIVSISAEDSHIFVINFNTVGIKYYDIWYNTAVEMNSTYYAALTGVLPQNLIEQGYTGGNLNRVEISQRFPNDLRTMQEIEL